MEEAENERRLAVEAAREQEEDLVFLRGMAWAYTTSHDDCFHCGKEVCFHVPKPIETRIFAYRSTQTQTMCSVATVCPSKLQWTW
jgi:hypothetical protein